MEQFLKEDIVVSNETKSVTESDGKKLWIFWVFGLGFFAGFLVSLVVADKIKGIGKDHRVSEHETAEAPISKPPVMPEEEPVRAPESHVSESVQEVVMTKAMRNRLLMFDFLKLLQDAEIRKYRHEGETRGIIVNKIRTGSIYEKMGFKDGDIIEQVNGLALADMEHRKAEMAEKLPGADQIEFKIRRDDKTKRIRVKIADPGTAEQ
ncbi:MAG: PDZ domain-containing protein [Proteobacteria bacterium]|nr:PDZ domain-containing protein [Pseudomonadota bacterium]